MRQAYLLIPESQLRERDAASIPTGQVVQSQHDAEAGKHTSEWLRAIVPASLVRCVQEN